MKRLCHFIGDVLRGLKLWRPRDGFRIYPPLVRVGNNVCISRQRGSTLSIQGTLRVGYQQMLGNHRLTGRPTQLLLSSGSAIETTGNVNIGSGCAIWLANNARLHIGGHSYINIDSKIFVSERVEIGAECAIAWNVSIMDSDFHPVITIPHQGPLPTRGESKPIKIGNHVWIGVGATILKGVTIGDGSIIAAGAVVNCDIPPNVLAGGLPAKVLKENVNWIR